MAIPIFVVGNGRTGTNLLGRLIGSSPEVEAHIEEEPVFSWVTHAAFYRPEVSADVALLKAWEFYENAIAKCGRGFYLDKSHPNLWHVPELRRIFPDAIFVAPYRDAVQTVLSGLEHEGVQSWYRRPDLPKPNRPLGITDKTEDAPLAAKLALRWKAHAEEIRTQQVHQILHYDLIDPDSAFAAMEVLAFEVGFDSFPAPQSMDYQIIRPVKWRTPMPEFEKLIDEALNYPTA